MKKYLVYQDIRNRINNLIIERLKNNNSKPPLKKVFTQNRDWTKLATRNNILVEQIPNKTL